MYTIKGLVKGKDNLYGKRDLFFYNRSTGAYLGTTSSDITTGEYTFTTDYAGAIYVVCKPASGETANAMILDNIIPTWVDDGVTVNNIGVPGEAGFGVGVCPNLPSTFEPLPGYLDKSSPNYGNYRYISDGSIVVWIPAFWFKWGTGANGLASNKVSVKPLSTYSTEAAAALDGFVMHRAFFDDGVMKQGFFMDKYTNSRNSVLDVASSIYNATPITASNTELSPITNFNGMPGYLWNSIVVSQKRGSGWFLTSSFMFGAIAILSNAHAQSSLNTTNCGWYDATYNFPKGSSNTGGYSFYDSEIRALKANPSGNNGYDQYLTGSVYPNKKNTHNGQLCGIPEIVGGLWNVSVGLSYINSNFRSMPRSFKMSSGTAGTTGNGFFSIDSDGMSQNLGADLNSNMTNNVWNYYNNSVTMFSGTTDTSTVDYLCDCLMFPRNNSIQTTTNPRKIGGSLYYYKVNYCMPIFGGAVGDGENAGISTIALNAHSASQWVSIGFRSAYYL